LQGCLEQFKKFCKQGMDEPAGARVCVPQKWTVFKPREFVSSAFWPAILLRLAGAALQRGGRSNDFWPRQSGVTLRSKTSRN